MSSAKTKARQCAVQALYQWQMTGQNLTAIEGQFKEDQRLKNAQKSYFSDLFHGVPKHLDKIDASMADFVDREVLHKPETPYRVVINEGVELAKSFGADGSHRYINGVLDKVAKVQRKLEIEAKQNKT